MRTVFALLLVLLAAGCDRGPNVDTLRKDVEGRLGQALPAGTVAIASFERRGSQSDTKAPDGETRRIVYFDTQIKLERDFDLGAWDAPGVAGVISALGAGPKGITGIQSGGNKAGDVLLAHGTALYQREGDGWVPVIAGGYRPSVAPSYATNAPQGAAAILDDMRTVIDSVPGDAAKAQREAIEEELVAARAAIRARLARVADGYGLAAGAQHGQYLRFAQSLAGVQGLRTVPLITRGGEENLRLLRAGKVTLALAQGDAALDAYEGRGNFADDGPYTALRAIGSLYPEPVHVLVRGDSALASVRDLKGRRVAIGEYGSASRTTAVRVLQAHGLGVNDITALELPLGEALVQLGQGAADAVVQVIGVPADSVRDAMAQVPLRLLPLSQEAIDALAGAKSGYFAHTIVHGTYPAQKDDINTIATAALLLVATDVSDTEVQRITRFVFAQGRDFAERGSAQGTQVSAATAQLALPVPLHGSAAKALAAIAAK